MDHFLTARPQQQILAAITRYFPEDMAALRAEIIALIARHEATGQPQPDGRADGQAVLLRHAPGLAGVEDSVLVALRNDRIAQFKLLVDTPLTCKRVFLDGVTPEDFDDPRFSRQSFGDHAERLYAALAQARSQPPRPPAEVTQCQQLFALLGPQDQALAILDTIERLDPTDPALCGAGVRFLQVIRGADFPGADRVRAEILIQILIA